MSATYGHAASEQLTGISRFQGIIHQLRLDPPNRIATMDKDGLERRIMNWKVMLLRARA